MIADFFANKESFQYYRPSLYTRRPARRSLGAGRDRRVESVKKPYIGVPIFDQNDRNKSSVTKVTKVLTPIPVLDYLIPRHSMYNRCCCNRE
jgi:hypothetical protein